MSISELRMVGEMPASSSAQTSSFDRIMDIRSESDLEILQSENARLKRSLQDAETKVQVKINDLPSPLKGLGRSSDLAAGKIVELSKKVRELSAKLGVAENKANSAEAQLAVYMASQGLQGASESNDTYVDANSNASDKDLHLKELTDKFNSATNKLFESRNQVQMLKQELKVVQKALINEVGDEASASSIMSGNANTWRGRAQQILSLQQKVAELQSKLSATDVLGKEKSALNLAISEKHAEKEKVAALTKELEALREELADFKSKGEAAKARIKVLSTDLNANKVSYQALQAKNNNDEQTISKLTNQLATLMEKAQERENNIVRQLNNKLDEISKELRQERIKSEQLREIIADRDQKIIKLEERLKVANTNLMPPLVHSAPNPPSTNCISPRPDELRPISRCSSVDRQTTASPMPQLQTTEAERLRLMELVTVLNKRVEHERKEHDRATDELRKERQRGAKLEMKLAKLEMEKVGGSRATYYRSNSTPNSCKATANHAEIEGLRDKCELLQEKCLALEARLETTKRDKEEESRMYMNILEETRQAVKEHIRPSVKSSGWSSTSLP